MSLFRRTIARRDAGCGFWSGRSGAVTVETVLAIVVFVVGFAGLVEVVGAAFQTDRMGRAAHAAARALALNPTATPKKDFACAAIRRELALAPGFDSECVAKWTMTIDPDVGPTGLPPSLDAAAVAGSGDMVLVRIGWKRGTLSLASPTTPGNPSAGSLVAFGLARLEP